MIPIKLLLCAIILCGSIFATIENGSINASSTTYYISIFGNSISSSTLIYYTQANASNETAPCNITNGTGTITNIYTTTQRGSSGGITFPYIIMIILILYFIWSKVTEKKTIK